MRILLSTTVGGPETLEFRTDAPLPVPTPGEIRIRVHAAALNLPDLLMIEDKYQDRPPRPFAPGSEVAGVVDCVGEGVDGFRPGQRVIAVTSSGGLAEYALCPAAKVSPLPDTIPFDEASALLVTYATAWYGLTKRAALRPGETLLVLGASGGVGLAAIELGRALGARVIASASSAEKLDVAKKAGADDGLIYPSGTPMSREQQRAFTQDLKRIAGPDGVSVIIDPVGGDYVEPAFRAIGWGGRYLIVGFAAGIAALPTNLPLLKGADLIGVYWAESILRNPDEHQRAVVELCSLYMRGVIRPRIHARFPLERGIEALQLLASRKATGKIIVEV